MALHLFPLFTDSAVLQADKEIPICGYASRGPISATLTCLANGAEQHFEAPLENGTFTLTLSPTPAGGPYELTICAADEKIRLTDILFGEVWILAGQSNMQMPLCSCFASSVNELRYADEIASSACDRIREAQSGPISSDYPLFTPVITRPWASIDPKTVGGVSAVGYFFAKRLLETLDVPVGIFNTSRGATPISDWMPGTGTWFNGSVKPITSLVARGVIWYQGEGDPNGYAERLADMITKWRAEFHNPDLQFHVIQLPRMRYEEIWFNCREEDKKACSLVDHCTYSVNIDTGLLMCMLAKGDEANLDAIHPYQKKEVGYRAADALAEKLYGLPVLGTSPYLATTETADGKILLHYDNVGSGLVLRGLAGYEIQGADGTWSDAVPTLIDTKTVALDAQGAVAVRYGFSNESTLYPETITDCAQCVCLYSKEGYPAEQFIISLV